MTEFLAVLVLLYVLYVLYEIYKTISLSDTPLTSPVVIAPQTAPTALASEAEVVAAPAMPEPPSLPSETVATPVQVESAKIVNLRNPATGEVSPVPGNYRFAKKWIKEAMVSEGLLGKVYKNSELTDAINGKVKEAIEEFKKLEKYHS